MSRAGEVPVCRPVAGTFHGLPTIGLASGTAWFEALADAGPRIVRLGLTGHPNLLAETPQIGWTTPRGPYRLLGGHRLWLAPESAGHHLAPDGEGLRLEHVSGGLRLIGRPDLETGCIRSIEVRLHAHEPTLRVLHEVRNAGPRPVDLSLWAITQLPTGGVAVLPQRRAAPGHGTRPNRVVALWPYASWDDPRLVVRDGLVAVRGDAGPEIKVGCADHEGWVAWAGGGVALVRRWSADPTAPYPDLGCTAEVFAGPDFTELEVLGPFGTLEPGGTAMLAETWELRTTTITDPGRLRDALAPRVGIEPAPATAPRGED